MDWGSPTSSCSARPICRLQPSHGLDSNRSSATWSSGSPSARARSTVLASCPSLQRYSPRLGEFLGLTWSEAHLNSAQEGRLSRNSKDGKGHSRDARESEYRSARQAHGG